MRKHPDKILLINQSLVSYKDVLYPCAIGEGGLSDFYCKREGDGKTPKGIHKVSHGFYRSDRITLPSTIVPMQPITPDMGWCDDPLDPNYNCLIHKPFKASHEDMWRLDHLYDIVLVTDYNINPIIPYKGSAIFIHLGQNEVMHQITPSKGCLKLFKEDLLFILGDIKDELIWQVE
jgi:L,D-peptidoglycan transpeptidase YkuD (ErfK/YbiS/YcfS/YnhG family)